MLFPPKLVRIIVGVVLLCHTSPVQCARLPNVLLNFEIALKTGVTAFRTNGSRVSGMTAAGGYNSEICLQQIDYLLNDKSAMAILAKLAMFDSWGKVPAGLFTGNHFALGNFDECLAFSYGKPQILGQYCLLPLNVTDFVQHLQPTDSGAWRLLTQTMESGKDLILRTGICVPSTCAPNVLLKMINDLFAVYDLWPFDVNTNLHCVRQSDVYGRKLRTIDIVAITYFSIIAAIMILSTGYELLWRNKAIKNPYFLAFSVYTNGKRLFKCTPHEGGGQMLACLHGIRVLSILWIVLSHAYMMAMQSPLLNLTTMVTWPEYFGSAFIMSGFLAVDTFLLLSGLLVTWTLLRQLERSNGSINVGLIYLHRYIRLTPVFASLILFTMSLMLYCGTGPVWLNTIEATTGACNTYWWSALLYIQNYVNPDEMCLGHSWYLSVDMQLFVVAPLIVYGLWRWKRKMVAILTVIVLLASLSTLVTFITKEFRLHMISETNSSERMKYTYYSTHSRMPVWLIGCLLGYGMHTILQTDKNANATQMGTWKIVAGWVLCVCALAVAMFTVYPLQLPHNMPSPLESGMYEMISRVMWAVAVSWIIYASHAGHGGVICRFLSLSVWQPFSRLSFCIYMCHMVVQLIMVATVRTTAFFSDWRVIHTFFGDIGLTLAVSIVWTLAFESPIINLEKLLLRKNRSVQ